MDKYLDIQIDIQTDRLIDQQIDRQVDSDAGLRIHTRKERDLTCFFSQVSTCLVPRRPEMDPPTSGPLSTGQINAAWRTW